MAMRTNVAPPIPAYATDSFALFTVQQRLPKILADVRAQLEPRAAADSRWLELEAALRLGGAIDLRLFTAESAYWRDALAAVDGQRWFELSFFDLEFLFYLALRSIAADLAPGFDIFARTRHAALREALPKIARALEAADDVSLEAALLQATLGNEADLSQLDEFRPGAEHVSLLTDQRDQIVERLRATDDARVVHILADNAGSELCFDLILADLVLSEREGTIELHLKPRPMFVSDALIRDAEATIAGFETLPSASVLRKTGERLRAALATGRLTLRTSPDWSEPRFMNALEPQLRAALQSAALVILKGDLNYRRCFEDRAWPADTPVATASVASGTHAYALRVLKSDSIVGLDADQVSKLFAAAPNWRTNGRNAVVQRVGR